MIFEYSIAIDIESHELQGTEKGMQKPQRTFQGISRQVVMTCLLALQFGTFMPSSVHAQEATDQLIEGAKQCTRQLPRYEREYAIPTHLLSAIASTESGRYHKGLNIKVPWPWTINADGAGYYLGSKAEAIAMVRKLQARGIKSIDVGCMQVNLLHHPSAFASLDEAFDPEHNVAYAASFLRSIYQEENSWKKAAAYYHSRTPSQGGAYVGMVYNSWFNIVDKLRMAQVDVPSSSLSAMNDMKSAAQNPGQLASSADSPYGASKVYAANARNTSPSFKTAGVQVTKLPEQRGKKVSSFHSARMNSIQVSSASDDAPRRDRGVMIVTPDIKVNNSNGRQTASNIPVTSASAVPQIIKVAQITPPSAPTPVSYSPMTASAATLNATQNPSAGRPAQATASHKNGPTFIFND